MGLNFRDENVKPNTDKSEPAANPADALKRFLEAADKNIREGGDPGELVEMIKEQGGDKDVKEVLESQAVLDALIEDMHVMLDAKDRGESIATNLFVFSLKLKEVVTTMSDKQIGSMLAAGVSAIAMYERNKDNKN